MSNDSLWRIFNYFRGEQCVHVNGDPVNAPVWSTILTIPATRASLAFCAAASLYNTGFGGEGVLQGLTLLVPALVVTTLAVRGAEASFTRFLNPDQTENNFAHDFLFGSDSDIIINRRPETKISIGNENTIERIHKRNMANIFYLGLGVVGMGICLFTGWADLVKTVYNSKPIPPHHIAGIGGTFALTVHYGAAVVRCNRIINRRYHIVKPPLN